MTGGTVARSAGYEKGNAWTITLQVILYTATRLLGRRRFVGNGQLGAPGGALVVANHISHIDPVFDTVYVRKAGRLPHVLAKSSLWKIPVLRPILNATGQIPVDRGGGAGSAALDAARKALADGKVVVIYPEGTVSREPDHWPMRPRPGVAILALSGDFPVIPVVHWGTQELYTSYQRGLKLKPFPRKDIHLIAGNPIDLSQWRGKPVDARAIRDVSYLIMNTIKDMLGAVRGETPPDELFDPKKAVATNGRPTGAPPAGERDGTAT
jgi:1-acyl-sn-glycerol-3-phosphate acyltransferase